MTTVTRLKCNYCGQLFEGYDIGAKCPECNEGVLFTDVTVLEDRPLAVPSGGQTKSVNEILQTNKPKPVSSYTRLRLKANKAEDLASILCWLGVIAMAAGIVFIFQVPIAGWALVSFGGGAFFWWGINMIIAQLMYVRAELQRLNEKE